MSLVEFVEEAKAEAGIDEGSRFPLMYYDGSRYLLDNKKEFIPINEASVKRHSEAAGLLTTEEKNAALNNIQTQFYVAFSGPLAGRNRGPHESGGQMILAMNSPKIIKAKEGDFPTLERVIQEMLGHDPTQVLTFYGWVKSARDALLSGKRNPGQALVLAGEANCGKSFLIDLIEKMLGGRRAYPYKYFTGKTRFNSDLAGAELLVVDDEAASVDIRARKALGAAMKSNLFGAGIQVEGKHKTPFSFDPFWRMVIALNDEPEELMLLPPLTKDIEDKIILFKCERFEFPKGIETTEERARFFNKLVSEMPGFFHFLEQWEIPEELRERRCGVRYYHEPSLLKALGSLSPEAALRELIQQSNEAGSISLPWEGTAASLKSVLCGCHVVGRDANSLIGKWMQATGTYLGRLEAQKQGVTKVKNASDGTQIWRVE